jgi:hypothetical protein
MSIGAGLKRTRLYRSSLKNKAKPLANPHSGVAATSCAALDVFRDTGSIQK